MNVLDKSIRFTRAMASNQLARLAPRLYLRLTEQTGRGHHNEKPEDVAKYFRCCVDDYVRWLDLKPTDVRSFFAGKHVMEYGPGDLPGVALSFYALGARRVTCVDRFPLVKLSPHNQTVLNLLIGTMQDAERARAEHAFNRVADPASGLRAGTIDYLVRPSGLSGQEECVDLIISRAVLEHVDDLRATFKDMRSALRPGGLAIHQVDLKSHGQHFENPLDFLCWSQTAWHLMHSGKGVPNRWRINVYRQLIHETGLEGLALEPTLLAKADDVASVRPKLAACFRSLSDEDLACLGFWMVLRKPESQWDSDESSKNPVPVGS